MKLIKPDYLVIIAIFFFFSCHVTTNYLIWHMQGVANQIEVAEEVIMQFEGNPVARWMLSIEKFKYIYTLVIMPGLVGGVYYAARQHLIKKGYPEGVMNIAVLILVMSISNFLNDFSILLGVLF